MTEPTAALVPAESRSDEATTATRATEGSAEADKMEPAATQQSPRPSPPSGPLSRWQNRLRIASTRHLQVPANKKSNTKAADASRAAGSAIDRKDGNDATVEAVSVGSKDEPRHEAAAFSQHQQNSDSNKTPTRFSDVKRALGDALKTARDVDRRMATPAGNTPRGSLHNTSLHSRSSTHGSLHGNISPYAPPLTSFPIVEAPAPHQEDDDTASHILLSSPIAPDSGIGSASATSAQPLLRDEEVEANSFLLHPRIRDCPIQSADGLSVAIPSLLGPPNMTQPFPTTATHPSVEEAQRKLIAQLQAQCKLQSSVNSELKFDIEALTKRKQEDDEMHKSTVKTLQREVEETSLKLSVLEQHFCQLNTEQEEKRVGFGDVILPSSSTTITQELADSIIQLDKAYVTDLRNTAARNSQELEKLQKVLLDLQTKSESVEQGLRFEIEDLKNKVECREDTISTLEQALTQLRESRFNNNTKKKNVPDTRNRSVTIMGLGSIADADADGTDGSSAISVSTVSTIATTTLANHGTETTNTKASAAQSDALLKLNDRSGLSTINAQFKAAEAVESAPEEKDKAPSDTIDEIRDKMNHKLASKDVIIAKLEHKVSLYQKKIKTLTTNISRRPAEQHPTLFNLRSLAVTNEMLDASSRRLEIMLKRVDERRQISGSLGQGDYNLEEDERQQHALKIISQADADHKAQLLSVAEKVAIVQEELKVSMRLLEQRMKNKLESMRDESANSSGNAETGQNSGERTQTDSLVAKGAQPFVFAERITQVHEQVIESIRKTELDISNQLNKLNDQIQMFRFEFTAKRDVIESLEMACAAHDLKIRALQHELDAVKSSTLSTSTSISLPLKEDEGSTMALDVKTTPVVITSDDVSVSVVRSDSGKDLASSVGASSVVSDVEDYNTDNSSIGSLGSERSI